MDKWLEKRNPNTSTSKESDQPESIIRRNLKRKYNSLMMACPSSVTAVSNVENFNENNGCETAECIECNKKDNLIRNLNSEVANKTDQIKKAKKRCDALASTVADYKIRLDKLQKRLNCVNSKSSEVKENLLE